MPEINLIDPESIARYLHEKVQESKMLSKLLRCALAKPLTKVKTCMFPVHELPPDAPGWLRNKWSTTRFYEFIPDDGVNIKVEHVKDWIEASIVNSEPWLAHVDSWGRPHKLLKIGTLDQAVKEADKYGELLRQRNANKICKDAAFEYELEHNDIRIVKSYDDGYAWVRLLTKIGATRESFLMRHCIGNGAYDKYLPDKNPETQTEFYSLRDANNAPHVTLQVDMREDMVVQCVGKQNVFPVEKYLPYLTNFLEDRKLCVDRIAHRLGFILQDGKQYPLSTLPDNYVFKGTLDVSKLDDFLCPDNLTVEYALWFNTNHKSRLKPCLKVGSILREDEFIEDDIIHCVIIQKSLGKSLVTRGMR